MNRKIVSIAFLANIVLLFSCADDNLSPILTFDKAGKGAYAKLLTESPRELDLANLGTAQYSYCVEFVDSDAGNTVSQYDVNVAYVDKNPSNGDQSAEFINLRSISADEFNSTDRNFKGSCVDITLSELLTAFKISPEDLLTNDQFQFVTTVTNTEDVTFGFSNSDSDVSGAAFGAHFNYTLKATCPLPDNKFTGEYTLSYIGDATGGFGVPFAEGPVTVEVNSPSTTQRKFTLRWAPDRRGFNVGPAVFDVVCDFITWTTLNTGLACTGGEINLVPGDVTPINNLTDDGEIILNIVEYQDDGGCGFDPIPKTIRLTKN